MADKKKTLKIPPSLAGKDAYIRPATTDDIANTQHWLLQSEPQMLSSQPVVIENALMAAETFQKSAGSIDAEAFMIVHTEDSQPVGRILYDRYNSHNRSAYIECVVDPDERKEGFATEGVRLLCAYLFNQRGLNKLWGCVAIDNQAGIALCDTSGFHKEGTLRQHYFYDGDYHDGLLYAMLRYEFAW